MSAHTQQNFTNRTAISAIGQAGVGLSYRGYSIADLAVKARFEEVAYLLMHGQLPTQDELEAYLRQLHTFRSLPPALKDLLEQFPATANPLDVMRTSCSMLGVLEPEQNFSHQYQTAARLLAILPAIITYWRWYAQEGVRIDTDTEEESLAGHFLQLLHGRSPSALQQRCLETALILHAEHAFDAATANARLCAATLADFYSAVTSALGTLRGTVHNDGSEAVMNLLAPHRAPEHAIAEIQQKWAVGAIIPGFDTEPDARSGLSKACARQLADSVADGYLYALAEAVEKNLDQQGSYPNVDFYSACVYRFLGIPSPLFAAVSVCARISGWAAHIFEQRADKQSIQPKTDYIGPAPRDWLPVERRLAA